MVKKVTDYIQTYRMIEPGDTIVAGVSGGADSVCLLFVLLRIREQLPFSLSVVHVDHGIRQEAGEDAAFVEKLCKENHIRFYLRKADIPALAKETGLSEEEAGRNFRYQAFREVLEAECGMPGAGRGRIAVAHNSNDQAETILFRLCRGTGLTGLAGIRPVKGEIIRPLLSCSREEIEAWLEAEGIAYREDSTNAEDSYSRNKIRHHVLPRLEEVCRGADRHICRAAENVAMAEHYITGQLEQLAGRCVTLQGEEVHIDLQAYREADPYMQGRLILFALERLTTARKDITASHVALVQEILAAEGNKEIGLPYGIYVCRQYEKGIFSKKEKSGKCYPQMVLQIPGVLTAEGLGRVELTVFPYEKTQNIPLKTYTKWFDYDKITSSVMLRTREPGDYLTINREGNRQFLQDYFVNEKVPKQERDSVYVLADGAHILWVPGYRISEYYKVTDKTDRILQVQVSEVVTKERSQKWLRR